MDQDNKLMGRATVKDEKFDATFHEMDVKVEERQRRPTTSLKENVCSEQRTSLNDIMSDPSLVLQAIISKYGDMTKDCTFSSEFFKSVCLEGICRVVQKLHNTNFNDMTSGDLDELYLFVNNAESLKVDMKWLRRRLDEISEAVTSRDELKRLEESKKENELKKGAVKKAIESKKSEMQVVEVEIQEIEKELSSRMVRLEDLKTQIEDIKSIGCSDKGLLDGLY